MSLKTIEQERAKFAYDRVKEVKTGNKESDYLSLVRGFASMILLNGLGQALAFLIAKGKNKPNEYTSLYNHIQSWLKNKFSPDVDKFDILQEIREKDSYHYRLYTKEALAFMVWMKKFSEAELKDNN